MNKLINVPAFLTFQLPTGETKEIVAHTVKVKQNVEIKESTNPGSSIKQ